MSTTLYRKYRPTNFSEIIDQNHIKITLQRAVATGKISHAYLFHGPRGIGKTTSARILAKAVNCLNPKEGEPCNTCEICTAINKGNSLDIVELDAASRRKIEEIKEFKEHIKYPPHQAKYKVFIIDEVHMLTDVSFNALLKTIEEPPDFAIFILCTTEIHKVPDTIISRCQRYDFKKIPNNEIVVNLQNIITQENIKVDKSILHTIAQLSEGCLRDAQGLLGQIIALGEKEITWEQASILLPRSDINLIVKFWNHLVTNDTHQAIKLIEQLSDEGADQYYFTDKYLEFVRRVMLFKVDKKLDELHGFLTDEDYQDVTKKIENVSLDRIKKILEVFLEKRTQFKIVPNPNVLLEMAVIEIFLENGHEQINKSSAPDTPQVAEKKTKISEKITPKSAPKTNLKTSKLNIEEKDTLIKSIIPKNYSLSGILKTSIIEHDSDHNIVVTVKHVFHKDQVEKDKNKIILLDAYKEQFGKVSRLVVKVDAKVSIPELENNVEQDNSKQPKGEFEKGYVDDIIKTFGGQVTEEGVIEE